VLEKPDETKSNLIIRFLHIFMDLRTEPFAKSLKKKSDDTSLKAFKTIENRA